MTRRTSVVLILIVNIILVSSQHISANIGQPSDHQLPPNTADLIYYNGTIITMHNDDDKTVNFVAVSKGRIIASQEGEVKMKRFVGPETKLINLQGKTLMPGFIDPHSHFSITAVRYSQGFDISPPPFGTVTSIPQLLSNIRDYITSNNIQSGVAISAGGYNDIQMAQRRHPTRFQLDSVSTVHPIVLTHFSEHIKTANSLALQLVDYTDSSQANQVLIDKFPNGSITGVCRETAMIPLKIFQKTFNKLTVDEIKETAYHYFSNGITTAQDIFFTQIQPMVYHQLGDELPIDINAYTFLFTPDLTQFHKILKDYPTRRVKVKGGKFILDGSIQGFTALLSKPYWVPQAMYSEDLTNYTYDQNRSCSTQACGQDNFPAPTVLRQLYRYLYFNNLDIIAHCNGDKAIDNMLEAIEWAKNHMKHETKTRVTMIHAQTVSEAQLDKMAELDIHPSFFPAHIYLWGEKHYQIFLGPERANRMNPVGSAARRGLKYTLHNDSPVVMMGLFNGFNTFFKGIHAAVNRKTINGRLLDDGTQKISIYDALKGVTINSAWQANQDGRKGSISVGKMADLIILNKNPLTIEPQNIDSLKVQTTIRSGQLVFGTYPSENEKQSFSNKIKVN